MALGFKQIKELLGKHGFGVIARDSKDEAISKVAKVVAGWKDEEVQDKLAELPGDVVEWINTELKLGFDTGSASSGDTGGDTPKTDETASGTTETAAEAKPGKAKADKPAKPPKAEKPKSDQGVALGTSYFCRQSCFLNPDWTLEQHQAFIKEKTGREISTVNISAIRSDMRRTVAVLIDAGMVTAEGQELFKKGEVKRVPPTPPAKKAKAEGETKTEEVKTEDAAA